MCELAPRLAVERLKPKVFLTLFAANGIDHGLPVKREAWPAVVEKYNPRVGVNHKWRSLKGVRFKNGNIVFVCSGRCIRRNTWIGHQIFVPGDVRSAEN